MNGISLDQLDPLSQSDPERTFVTRWLQLSDTAPDPVAEYTFSEKRKFRFDFAWPVYMVAIEIHGIKDHTSVKGLTRDCIKMNLAQVEGWTVFQATPGMLRQDPAGIIEMILDALDAAYIKAGNANRARQRVVAANERAARAGWRGT